jgi:hypothetical protein
MYQDLNNVSLMHSPHLRSKVLRLAPREEFDPSNREHCESVIKFIETGKWDRRLDVQGAINVPYECIKKMAYYAFHKLSSE